MDFISDLPYVAHLAWGVFIDPRHNDDNRVRWHENEAKDNVKVQDFSLHLPMLKYESSSKFISISKSLIIAGLAF